MKPLHGTVGEYSQPHKIKWHVHDTSAVNHVWQKRPSILTRTVIMLNAQPVVDHPVLCASASIHNF